MANFTNDQFDRFIDRMGRTDEQFDRMMERMGQQKTSGSRLSHFSSAVADEWLDWKRHFISISRMAGWNDMKCRHELSTSLRGQAGRMCEDIQALADPEPGEPDHGQTIAIMLEQCQRKFIPVNATDAARTEFDTAKMDHSETLTLWHSRLKTTFLRGYPTLVNVVQHDPNLLKKYILGVHDEEIRRLTLHDRPQTYDDALAFASNHLAAKQALDGAVMGMGNLKIKPPVPLAAAINALEKGQSKTRRDGTCHFCESPDHYRADCVLYARFVNVSDSHSSQSGGNRKAGGPPTGGGRHPQHRSAGTNAGSSKGKPNAYSASSATSGRGRGRSHSFPPAAGNSSRKASQPSVHFMEDVDMEEDEYFPSDGEEESDFDYYAYEDNDFGEDSPN